MVHTHACATQLATTDSSYYRLFMKNRDACVSLHFLAVATTTITSTTEMIRTIQNLATMGDLRQWLARAYRTTDVGDISDTAQFCQRERTKPITTYTFPGENTEIDGAKKEFLVRRRQVSSLDSRPLRICRGELRKKIRSTRRSAIFNFAGTFRFSRN